MTKKMTKEMEKKFREFLKSKGATRKYNANVRKVKWCDDTAKKDPIKFICGLTSAPISGAFTWSETSEGTAYWYALNKEWEFECNLAKE